VTFDLEAAGREYRISIDHATGDHSTGPSEAGRAGGVALRVTAPPLAAEIVDCRPTDLGFVLQFADGRVLDVAATERPGGWLIQLPRVSVAVSVDGRRGRAGAAGTAAATGEQRVIAPMPGRVVRVLVRAGDQVEAGQGLIVVEAMKMENELTSPKAGRVREIAVAEGGSVEAGRLLVVVE